METGTLSVRGRGGKDLGVMKVESLISMIHEQTEKKSQEI